MLRVNTRGAHRQAAFALERKSACLSKRERNLPGAVRGLKQTLTAMASIMRQERERQCTEE